MSEETATAEDLKTVVASSKKAAAGGEMNEATRTNFHIPESNASDVAPSECSSYYTPRDWPSNLLTKTEALSGSQHVLLWLTRTSMSDMPSVPSLKNLVTASVVGGHCKSSRSQRSTSSEKPIQRNFSTKSFMKSSKYDLDEEQPPMRKCETVIALSRVSTAGSTTSSTSSKKKQKKSTLSVFKSLAKATPQPRPPKANLTPVTTAAASTIAGSVYDDPAFPGMRPQNRLRSTNSSVMCSRCTSVMSVNNSRCTSQLSLHQSVHRKASNVSSPPIKNECSVPVAEPPILCKICLVDCPLKDSYRLQQCRCIFCKECMVQYLSFEIMAGAYEISCPDPACDKEGIFQFPEIEHLVGKDMMDKHKSFRLNTEIALDANRAWCPKPGCNTVCHICASATNLNKPSTSPRAVKCPECDKEFCSICFSNWHPGMTCHENGKKLVMQSMSSGGGGEASHNLLQHQHPSEAVLLLDEGGNIKRCPMCQVPIERDAGCAQMMCKRCKHVFCWFCLTSLDDDFLLRHYDSGACQGKLGHTRASLLWHRAQVIGIFAGFVILLLVSSPMLLVAAPCIFCCKCKSCTELEEELTHPMAANDNHSPAKTSRSNSGIAIQIIKD